MPVWGLEQEQRHRQESVYVHNSRPADAVRVDGVHGVHRAVVLLVLTLQSRMFPIRHDYRPASDQNGKNLVVQVVKTVSF